MEQNLAAFKKPTLLEELIEDYQSSPELTKVALKAGLKYFPNELWKLLVAVDGFYTELSPHAFLMDTNRTTMAREEGLTFIEECLEEVGDLKLQEPDPTTNLYPFMTVVASDQSCPYVDLVYHLLRKDPSVALQFNHSCTDKRGHEEEGAENDGIDENGGVVKNKNLCRRH